MLEGGPKGSWDERGIGTRHVVHDNGGLWMVFEGVDGNGRHRLGLASSANGGLTWEKRMANSEGGVLAGGGEVIFGGREGEEGAWDRGNVGTPFLVKRPEGSGSPGTRKNPGWYLYYVGTSTDEATGKTSYAIGCAEQVDPRMGLAGPWRRVPATC